MKLSEVFESKENKKKLSHIRNLFALAYSDGHLDDDEMRLISHIAIEKGGIEMEEIERIMTRPQSVKLYVPDSEVERIEQLYDLVSLMAIDGKIEATELKFCEDAARALRFKEEKIRDVIKDMISSISRETTDSPSPHLGNDTDTEVKDVNALLTKHFDMKLTDIGIEKARYLLEDSSIEAVTALVALQCYAVDVATKNSGVGSYMENTVKFLDKATILVKPDFITKYGQHADDIAHMVSSLVLARDSSIQSQVAKDLVAQSGSKKLADWVL